MEQMFAIIERHKQWNNFKMWKDVIFFLKSFGFLYFFFF